MTVYPSGPSFFMRVGKNGLSEVIAAPVGKPELTIRFKHLTHAFLVFSFQEGTAQAFANDRMIADGNVSHAIRLVRCLNKMEALILPRIIAERAVKRYDAIPLTEKITKAARIYGLVAKSLILGN
jgi:predicted alpha/beta-hydrolase family hydrolase